MRSLSASEVRRILAVIPPRSPFGARDRAMLVFLLHTGLWNGPGFPERFLGSKQQLAPLVFSLGFQTPGVSGTPVSNVVSSNCSRSPDK